MNATDDATQAPPTRHRRKKTTRPDLTHWAKPWEFTVRAATNAEGEQVHALVDLMTRQYGYVLPKCQWDNIAPFWYVADLQGVLIGAVQICIGRPLSRIELLSVHPDLSHSKKAKVVKALIYRCFQALEMDGSTLACALIADRENEFSRVVERLGARFAVNGKMFFYQLDRR